MGWRARWEAVKESLDPASWRVCGVCIDYYGSTHLCEVPEHCDCDDEAANCEAKRRPIVIEMVQQVPLEKLPTYIGVCCREWELVYGQGGRCGLCGTAPVFLRSVTYAPEPPRERERIEIRSTT